MSMLTEDEVKEHNAKNKVAAVAAFVRNVVYDGRQAQLEALGVPPEVIAEAEAYVAAERAAAKAYSEANPLSADEQALALLHPSDPEHAALHEKVTGEKPPAYDPEHYGKASFSKAVTK